MKAFCAQDGLSLSFLGFLVHVDTRALTFTTNKTRLPQVISSSPFVGRALRIPSVLQRAPKSM